MAFAVKLEQFEGPLDLLLQLIEREKLAITEISLIKVVEPFVAYVSANRGLLNPHDLADFLLVSARLVYLKAQALLPSLIDPELETGPSLTDQLKLYAEFSKLAAGLRSRADAGPLSFSRGELPISMSAPGFFPPLGLTAEDLKKSLEHLIHRLQPLKPVLPSAVVEKIISLEERLAHIRERLQSSSRLSFQQLIGESADKQTRLVSFLALLELIKEHTISVSQSGLFTDIELIKNTS